MANASQMTWSNLNQVGAFKANYGVKKTKIISLGCISFQDFYISWLRGKVKASIVDHFQLIVDYVM